MREGKDDAKGESKTAVQSVVLLDEQSLPVSGVVKRWLLQRVKRYDALQGEMSRQTKGQRATTRRIDAADYSSEEIRLARALMRRALTDAGLRQSYVANIAMLVYDELHALGYKPKLRPEDREHIAEGVLRLLFAER